MEPCPENVPFDGSTTFTPRGGTSLDVMFTDDDWDVPRRITTIALNDDVDEPTEIRNIEPKIGSCADRLAPDNKK